MHVYCDFDGTISIEDTTDAILSTLADPQWQIIEAEWKAGRIGSAECMQRQIALIQGDKTVLNATLDGMAIDPYFPAFLEFCRKNLLPVEILSDGVDYFIERILARHQLTGIPVTANHLVFEAANSYRLTAPHSNVACAAQSGVCKCRIVSQGKEPRVFIGDGRSDFCAAGTADIVFAKGTLATYCEQQGIAYFLYESFADIELMLASLIPSIQQRRSALFAPGASPTA